MAIFYNHIKGCGAGSTGVAGNTSDVWSWIKWASSATVGDTNETVSSKAGCWRPVLYVGTENDINKATDYGYIITSDATNQTISTLFSFENDVNIKQNCKLFWHENSYITGATDVLTLNGTNIALDGSTSIDDIVIIDSSSETFGLNVKESAKIHYSLYVGADTKNEFDPAEVSEGTIKAEHKCEALYFNATSDRRAKSNITPAEFSALSVVKQLPVYTFNYLNMEESVIGLIAQEAAEHNLNGFNMVDNLDASGKCGDFMQMKESKLVYILWKAVQELSAEVEELKSQIASLK